VAGPILQELADATRCNAEFTRLMDGELRLLMWVPPRLRVGGLRVVSRPGDVQAAHATAAGKVWLSALDDAALDAWLAAADLPPLGPNTIVEADVLRDEILTVRREGHALNREEDGEGVFALAVAIRTPDGAVQLGSLGLTRPLAGVDDSTITSLHDHATAAAARLGAMLPRGEELIDP
jgi:IclR family pca regulon transcriptional regulator